MKYWEYLSIRTEPQGSFYKKIDQSQLDQNFNELGMQGWELVNSVDLNSGGSTILILSVFKRLKA